MEDLAKWALNWINEHLNWNELISISLFEEEHNTDVKIKWCVIAHRAEQGREKHETMPESPVFTLNSFVEKNDWQLIFDQVMEHLNDED